MKNTNERPRNGATEDAPNINQTASSASPSPTCSPSSFLGFDWDGMLDRNISQSIGNLEKRLEEYRLLQSEIKSLSPEMRKLVYRWMPVSSSL